MQLELEGHTVALARTETDAFLRMVELKPEAALVDLRAGGAPLDFARRVRAAGYAGRLIALAAERTERAIRDARAAGFDDVVAAPIDSRKLRESLDAV